MYKARLYYYPNTQTYELQNLAEAIIVQGSDMPEIRNKMMQKGFYLFKGEAKKDQFGMRYADCTVMTPAELDGEQPMQGEDAEGNLVPVIHLDELACAGRIERHYYNGQNVYR